MLARADFTASGNGSIAGRILFGNNEPAPNTDVTCIWEGFDGVLFTYDDVVFKFVADASGDFTSDGMTGGQLSCQGKDSETGSLSLAKIIDVDPNSPIPIGFDLVLQSTESLVRNSVASLTVTGVNISSHIVFAVVFITLGAFLVFIGRNRKPKHAA